MKYYQHITETIGNTPLVKINTLNKGIHGTILAKVEYLNPGNSIKDRIALKMIEDAEKKGILKPGGTIIEGTSGNTGMGLALVAIAKGYKCIFTMADKQSQEKINILRAVGAEVVVCPTNVEPEDPRSYYSVAKKLNQEIPNSFYPNQYDNMSNTAAHYETTGPEIWNDTDGKITHFVAGMGTGGTISGISKFLKEKNPNLKTIGVDTYGSVFKKYKETGIFDENEIFPYLTEGIGEDILPKNVDFSLVDNIIKVTDKDAALMTRRLSKEEGLFVGWSCGSAMYGALAYAKDNLKKDDVMVVILPDHGTRYLGKVYNDTWMKDHGFIEDSRFISAATLIQRRNSTKPLVSIQSNQTVKEAVQIMANNAIDQIPVMNQNQIVGSLSDTKILQSLILKPQLSDAQVSEVMDAPFQIIGIHNTLDSIASILSKDKKAVMVRDEKEQYHIITQSDLLLASLE